MGLMQPDSFVTFVEEHGEVETYTVGQVFHTQDFPNRLFVLKSGYVKRYQATQPEKKVLELIYGPGHIVSLSQLYKRLFGVSQNQNDFIYIYQAMTDVQMMSIDGDKVISMLEERPELYKDFFYESGLKLRSNIFRLASNSIKDDGKKVAHQLMSLAYEFADYSDAGTESEVMLPLPQSAIDLAEQLNITSEVVESAMDDLVQANIIKVSGTEITILDTQLLKDAYLQV